MEEAKSTPYQEPWGRGVGMQPTRVSNTFPQTGHQMKGWRPVWPRAVVLPDQPVPSNTLLVSPIQRKKMGSEKGYSDVSRDRNTTDAAGRNKVGVGGRIFLDVSQEPATCHLDQTHRSC